MHDPLNVKFDCYEPGLGSVFAHFLSESHLACTLPP